MPAYASATATSSMAIIAPVGRLFPQRRRVENGFSCKATLPFPGEAATDGKRPGARREAKLRPPIRPSAFLAGTHRPRASVFHPPPYRCSQSYTLSDSLLSQERAFHICGKPQSPILLLFHRAFLCQSSPFQISQRFYVKFTVHLSAASSCKSAFFRKKRFQFLRSRRPRHFIPRALLFRRKDPLSSPIRHIQIKNK